MPLIQSLPGLRRLRLSHKYKIPFSIFSSFFCLFFLFSFHSTRSFTSLGFSHTFSIFGRAAIREIDYTYILRMIIRCNLALRGDVGGFLCLLQHDLLFVFSTMIRGSPNIYSPAVILFFFTFFSSPSYSVFISYGNDFSFVRVALM